jgi:cell cycle arrest protein BUB3
MLGRKLPSGPSDGITNVVFGQTKSNRLLVSSWDGSVRLYDARSSSKVPLLSSATCSGPVLDCSFVGPNDTKGLSAGLDGNVRIHDFATETSIVLGAHIKPIKCVEHVAGRGVFTAGWDCAVKLWDERCSHPTGSDHPLQEAVLPGKAFSMTSTGDKLIIACSGRFVEVLDVRQLSVPLERRTSSLKLQTRCVRAMPDGLGYVVGSVEGRVAVEYFDDEKMIEGADVRKRYAFRCHRRTTCVSEGGDEDLETVYPVNAIAFAPRGTFATGGCDGCVNVWDGANRKRLTQFEPYPTSIAALSFSSDGSLLAVASSYTFEEGDFDAKQKQPEDAVYVREVDPKDIAPKPRRAKENSHENAGE